MSCHIVFEQGQSEVSCHKPPVATCVTCGEEICRAHTYICCGETFGACCIAQHVCARTLERLMEVIRR
jgi:hypothetical protein